MATEPSRGWATGQHHLRVDRRAVSRAEHAQPVLRCLEGGREEWPPSSLSPGSLTQSLILTTWIFLLEPNANPTTAVVTVEKKISK